MADDNADMRDYMCRLLRAARARGARSPPTAQAALEAARAEPPDLVLSDVMMPRLDGFGLLRDLRADPELRDTAGHPAVGPRGRGSARRAASNAGADDYLTKPFSARELLARVAGNLQLARLRRETETQLREEARTLEISTASARPWRRNST